MVTQHKDVDKILARVATWMWTINYTVPHIVTNQIQLYLRNGKNRNYKLLSLKMSVNLTYYMTKLYLLPSLYGV